MARPQRTISNTVELSGPALFSGKPVNVRLLPAEASTGFLFVRTDLPDSPVVPATTDSQQKDFRCTTLLLNNVEVRAVEHILSACAGVQVDNLIIELDNDEMPALGGCASEYGRALLEAGVVDQNAERPVLKLEQTITESEGGATIVAMPGEEGLTVSYVLDFEEGYGPAEALTLEVNPDRFMEEVAPARTFALEQDRETFMQQSLGGGVSDDNAFIVCRDGSAKKPRSLAPAQLRFPNEAVRHKILDFLGDLALANIDLHAKVVAVRSGHKLNSAFARRLRSLLLEEAGPEEYMDVREIRRVLPHRYPFLMVDRVLQVEQNRIVALKNVSVNEPFFQGHYPDYPIFPGALQLEALAQTAGMLFLRRLEHTGKVALWVSIDSAKFRRPVRPGDQLILEVEAVHFRSRTATVKATGTVNGQVACEAEMRFMLVDADAL